MENVFPTFMSEAEAEWDSPVENVFSTFMSEAEAE